MDTKGKATGDSAPIARVPDARVAAFAKLVNAVEFGDAVRMKLATRELRSLGFGVVVLAPVAIGKGAGR